ncbi:hypothetical protein KUTeg_007311 [Tegillarca granosa]|uniref:Fibrinogen C-terminal domain-containing protein n=1 Tax=Tegillarca granosa TaxID=220873 RepID=A0ABQ9FG45_TEGGR|nr:hypothetical protein KUTeg_007311 [Tegillarca granosa]
MSSAHSPCYDGERTCLMNHNVLYLFRFLKCIYVLGNDRIHLLTKLKSCQLRIDMENFNCDKKYAKYSNLQLDARTLFLYGDGTGYHNGHTFSTKDKEHDANGGSCARTYVGALWYRSCYHLNLNGKYMEKPKYCPIGMLFKTTICL